MAVVTRFSDLSGKWLGTKQVWLAPGEPALESESAAHVSSVAQDQFVVLAYTWRVEEEAQDGMIIFPFEIGATWAKAIWLDSWHVKNDIMVLEATHQAGIVTMRGSYPAPSGPDWGWRIEIEVDQDSSLVIRMYNITPDGQEMLGVLGRYERLA